MLPITNTKKPLIAIASVAMLAGGLIAGAENAEAKTLREYDAEISQQQKVVTEKQSALEEANKRLDEATQWYYKNGNAGSLVDLVLTSNGVTEAISRSEYADRVCTQYREQVAATTAARDEAQSAVDELQKLRGEAAARAKSLENASEIHFQQGGGQPWSSLPYWTGTIASSGCGLCSYTVMVDVLTGNDYTPTDMLRMRGDWKGMDGYPDDKTGSGRMTHAEWTKNKFDISSHRIDVSLDAMKSEMNGTEKVAIVCAAGSSFKNNDGSWRWSSGHFIAVFAHDEHGFHVTDSAVNTSQGKNVIYSDSDMQRLLRGTSKIVMYSN